MAFVHKLGIAVVGGIAIVGVAAPALAEKDIPYTWNNRVDKDAKGKFQAEGEHVFAYEYEGDDYVNYRFGSNTGLRWYIPGSEDKYLHDLNLDINEGVSFSLQVCENKSLAPDDCSSWQNGEA